MPDLDEHWFLGNAPEIPVVQESVAVTTESQPQAKAGKFKATKRKATQTTGPEEKKMNDDVEKDAVAKKKPTLYPSVMFQPMLMTALLLCAANVLPASESVIDVENEVDRARKLAELYGGQLQFHTRTHELFGIDFGQFIFRTIAEIVADIKAELKERDAVDQPDTQDGDTTDDILDSLIAELGEGFFFDKVVDLIDDEQNGAAAADQEANEQQATIDSTGEPAIIGVLVANPEVDRDAEKAETWARRCSADCIIPAQWATRLHAGFLRIDPGGTAKDICRAMDEFERCVRCSSEKRCDVGSLDKCTNTLNLLCATMVHFQHLRTVLRRYYELRQSFVWLRSVDKAVEHGDVVVLTELINKPNLHKNLRSRIAESVEREEKSLHSEDAILRNDHYRSMIDAFEEAIRNFRAYPCEIPPLAAKNGMDVDEVPSELQGLNWVETILIQLVKPFQTVIKLKPYGHHNVDLVCASRGLCTHFPMPLQGTIDHTFSTLPSTEGLKILVDSILTKENKSYRTPVDVPKVVAALVWLKEHNPLYKEITIDRNSNFDNVVEEIEDSGDCPPASRKRSTANIVSDKLLPTAVIDLIDVCELNGADDSPVVEYWISEDQVQDQPCQLRIPMTSRIC
uniref:DUF6570 domain-containing protein n=1 Tax=Plectus sambesii TaxID=2011161 RepID=A0A914XIB8_9BILA